MPMGGCDRLKNYFSDYLEKKLDPLITSEIDQHLHQCENCKRIVQQLSQLQSVMAELPAKKCSEDFNLKLHQRIHADTGQKFSSIKIKRYSFAFSFAMLGLIAVFFIISLIDQKKEDLINQPVMEPYAVEPKAAAPVPDIAVEDKEKNPAEFDIKTKSNNELTSDSSDHKNPAIDNSNIKYVGSDK